MTFLPIVERELTVRAKRRGARWLRWSFVVLGVLMAGLMLMSMSGAVEAKEAGRGVYAFLVWTVFFFACAAALLTADCVGSERREGTLGLLFLTNLKGYDVVLGKLAAAALDALYAIIGLTPLLALPLLAGGVTGGEVARAALAMMNVLFVSLAVGLFATTRSSRQTGAMRLTMIWVGGLMILPCIAGLVLKPVLFFPAATASPGYAFVASADLNYSSSPSLFWWSLVVAHLEGWLFLALASWTLARNWREGVEAPARPGKRATSSPADLADPASKTTCGQKHSLRPVDRLALQLRGQRALAWVATAVVWLGTGGLVTHWLGMILGLRMSMSAAYGLWGFSVCSSFGSAAAFAWVGSRFFLESRRDGTLEVLLTTPVGAREIISGQWRALWHWLRVPICLVGLASLLTSLQHFSFYTAGNSAGSLIWKAFIVLLVRPGGAVLEVLALCWIAIWFGLQARKPIAAVAWAVGVVQGGPWVGCYLISLVLGASGGWRGSWPSAVMIFWQFVLPIAMATYYVAVIIWAQTKLRRELPAAEIPTFIGALRVLPHKIRAGLRRARHWTPVDSK